MKSASLIFPIAAAVMALSLPQMVAQTPEAAAAQGRGAADKKAAPAGAGNSGGAAPASAGSATTADRTELLRSMDTDGDGKISSEEFAKYQKAHGGTGLNPTNIPAATPSTPKPSVKGNGDTGQSDALNNTAPSTGKTGSEAGRPVR